MTALVLPRTYFRYVDDTFAIFDSQELCEDFLTHLNALHPSLKFTCEMERNNALPFLDVLVEKSDGRLLTSVYRKPTFTGQYTRWDSFSATSYKLGLINNLVTRAIEICSPCKLSTELESVKRILRDNGYPDHVIDRGVQRAMDSRARPAVHGPKKCPVYLKLPWRGKTSEKFAHEIKKSVSRAYFTVSTRVIFTTNRMVPKTRKDVLPSPQLSNVIYQFQCRCDAVYVGRTSQRLEDRIKQHVPSDIHKASDKIRTQPSRNCKTANSTSVTSKSSTKGDSAIGQHLLNNPECAQGYNPDQFSIVARARSFSQLLFLEALYIQHNDPLLCRQKEFIRALNLF